MALIYLLWPNSILSWAQYSLRIKRRFNRFIQFHLRIVVEGVRICNLVHDSNVRPVLSPASLRSIIDQSRNQPVGTAPRVWILSIETVLHQHPSQERVQSVQLTECRQCGASLACLPGMCQ